MTGINIAIIEVFLTYHNCNVSDAVTYIYLGMYPLSPILSIFG